MTAVWLWVTTNPHASLLGLLLTCALLVWSVRHLVTSPWLCACGESVPYDGWHDCRHLRSQEKA